MASFANLSANLKLNIQDFAKNLNLASGRVDKFAADLNGKTVESMKELNKQTNAWGLNLKSVSRVVSGIVISQAFYGMVQQIKSATNAVWEFTKQLEYAQIAYSNMFGDVELATEFINVLEDFAARTPFSFTESEKAAKRLLAYGIEYKNIMYVMEGIMSAASAQGDPQRVEQISRAIGQIFTYGKLMTAEVRQLTEAGIPVYEILQEELGLTQEQLRNLGNEAIPASKAINALIDGINKRFGNVFAASSKTITGIISNIKDNATMLASGIMEPLTVAIKSALSAFGDFLFRMREIFELKGIGGLFEALFPPEMHAVLRQFAANFAEVHLAGMRLVYALGGLLKPVLEALLRVYNAFVPILTTVTNALAGLVRIVTSNATAMKWLTAALAAAAAMWVIFKVKAIAAAVVTAVVTAISKALAGLSAVLTFVVAHPFWALLIGLGGILIGVSGGFGKLSDKINGFFKSLTKFNGVDPDKVLLPSQEERANDLDKFNNKLEGTSDAMDDLADSTGKATKAAKGLLSFDEVFKLNEPDEGSGSGEGIVDSGLEELLETFKGLGGAYTPEVPDFSEYADMLTTGFVEDLKEAFNNIKSKLMAAGLGAIIGGALGGIIGGPVGIKIGAIAGAIAGWFWDDLAEALEITDTGKIALPIATALGTAIGYKIKGPFGGIIGAGIGLLVGWIIDEFARGFETGDWTGIGQPIATAIGATIGSIAGGPLGGAIGAAIGALVGWITETLSKKLGMTEAGSVAAPIATTLGTGIGFLAGGPLGAGIGAAIGALVSWIFEQLMQGFEDGDWVGVSTPIGTGIGAAIGMIAGGPAGAAIGAAIGAFVGWIVDMFVDGFTNGNWNFTGLSTSLGTGTGAAIGMVAGGPAGAAIGAAIGALVGWIVSKFKENWGSVTESFTAPFKEFGSKVAEYFKGIWDDIKTAFEEKDWFSLGASILLGIGKGFVGAIGTVLNAVWAFLKALWGAICSAFGIHSPATVMEPLGENILLGILVGFTNAIGSFLKAIADFGKKVIRAVSNWLSDVTSVVGSWFSKFIANVADWLSDTLDEVSDFFANTVSTVLDSLGGILEDVGSWFSDLFKTVSDWLSDVLKNVVDFFGDVWNTVTSKLSDVFNKVSGWFSNLISNVGTWLSSTFSKVTGFFSDVWNTVTTKLSDVFKKVSDWFGDLISDVSSWLSDMFSKVTGFFSDVWSAVTTKLSDIFSKVSSWFSSLISNIGTWLSNTLSKVTKFFSDVWSTVTNKLSEILSKVSTWFGNIISSVGSWLSSVLSKVTGFFSNVWSTVTTKLSDILGKVSSWFSGLITSVGTWLSNTLGKITGFFGNVWTTVNIKLSEVFTKLSSWFTSLPSNVSRWLGSVWRTVSDWFDDLIDGVGDWMRDLWDGLTGWMSSIGKNITSWWDNLWGNKKASVDVSGNVTTTKTATKTSEGWTKLGHADGGIFNREHIARFAEGNKAEAIIPLENASAMQPFVNAVSQGILEGLAPVLLQTGNNTSSLPPMYVGTLVADERGLKQLYKKFELIQIQENARRGLASS